MTAFMQFGLQGAKMIDDYDIAMGIARSKSLNTSSVVLVIYDFYGYEIIYAKDLIKYYDSILICAEFLEGEMLEG